MLEKRTAWEFTEELLDETNLCIIHSSAEISSSVAKLSQSLLDIYEAPVVNQDYVIKAHFDEERPLNTIKGDVK